MRDLIKTRYGLIAQRRAWWAGRLRALAAHPSGGFVVGGYGRRVLLVSPDLADVVCRLRVPDPVRALAFSPGGERLAVLTAAPEVRVYAVPPAGVAAGMTTPSQLDVLHPQASCAGVTFLGDQVLAAAGAAGAVAVWYLVEGRETRFRAGERRLVGVARAGPGLLVVAAEDGALSLHDERSGRELERVACGVRSVSAFAAAPVGGRVAVGGSEGRFAVLQRSPLRRLLLERVPDGWIMCLAFSADGRELAAGCKAGNVQLVDADVGDVVGALPVWYPELGDAAEIGIAAAAWTASGEVVATHGTKRIGLWSPRRTDPWALLAGLVERIALPGDLAGAVRAALQARDATALEELAGAPGSSSRGPYRIVADDGGIIARLRAAVARVSVANVAEPTGGVTGSTPS